MSIPTFSNRQNLGTVQPTPSISTREFTLKPGAPQTLKIVGTSVYVSQCYAVDADGYQLPAACRITLGHSAPFLSETGTSVEFKYYGTPFNEITLESVGNERVFVVLQVGYMLECRKGDAGTAGAIAILREKIQQNREEIESLIEQLNAIGPATSTTYGLVKYAAETVATNDNAPVCATQTVKCAFPSRQPGNTAHLNSEQAQSFRLTPGSSVSVQTAARQFALQPRNSAAL